MAAPTDPFKGVDWKSVGNELQKDPSSGAKSFVKKKLPKKIRQVPESYYLPRYSRPVTAAFFCLSIAGGIGAGMLIQNWIDKKIKEDGGIIWKADD